MDERHHGYRPRPSRHLRHQGGLSGKFRHYTELIQPGGALIIHKGLEMKQHVQDGVKIYEYSQNEGDFHAENIKIENGGITFDFISPIENVTGVELGQPVPINITNGVAAMAMAQLNGCTADELRNGMKTYGGVDRRFDFKIKNNKLVFCLIMLIIQRRYIRVRRVSESYTRTVR